MGEDAVNAENKGELMNAFGQALLQPVDNEDNEPKENDDNDEKNEEDNQEEPTEEEQEKPKEQEDVALEELASKN